MIWKKDWSIEKINERQQNTLGGRIGIEVTEKGDDYLVATMPADHRTFQPMGIVHGGASVALAETVGSIAANMAAPDGSVCVGLEINANHIRPVTEGLVTGKATPLHLGRSTQVWSIVMTNDKGKTTCVSRLTMAVRAPVG